MSLAQLHVPMYFIHILHYHELTVNTTLISAPIDNVQKLNKIDLFFLRHLFGPFTVYL